MDFKIAEQKFKEKIKPLLKYRKPNIYYSVVCDRLFAGGKVDKIDIEYDGELDIFLIYLGNPTFGPYSLKSVCITDRYYGFLIYGTDKNDCSVVIHIDFS